MSFKFKFFLFIFLLDLIRSQKLVDFDDTDLINHSNKINNSKKINSFLKINSSVKNMFIKNNESIKKIENDNVLFILDDKPIENLNKNEIKEIICIGDLCEKIELKQNLTNPSPFRFGIENKPETIFSNYTLVCKNIQDEKRNCYLKVELNKKDELNEKKSKNDVKKSTILFIFIFIAVEIVIIMAGLIIYRKGPFKNFLRSNRT